MTYPTWKLAACFAAILLAVGVVGWVFAGPLVAGLLVLATIFITYWEAQT